MNAEWRSRLRAVASRSTCRITTRGRKTGRPHAVTIWFAVDGDDVALATLRAGRDWPRNVRANPDVEIDLGEVRLRGAARMVVEETRRREIETLLARKYRIARVGSWFGLRPQAVFEVKVREAIG